MTHKRLLVQLVILILVVPFLFAACRPSQPAPAAAPTSALPALPPTVAATVVPATIAPPTATHAPPSTATATLPSATIAPPTATLTPAFTATLPPTQRPASPTPVPTAAPTLALATVVPIVATMPITETKGLVYARGLQPDNPNEWNATANAGVEWKLDEYAPVEPGTWPVAVLVNWAGEARSEYTWTKFAQLLAAQGVRVYVIDYPDYQPPAANQEAGRGYREMADSIACAVRYARSRAEAGQGEPVRTALVGFCLGGGAAAQVAVAGDALDSRWEEYAAAGGPPRQVACEMSEGSTRVDALVGSGGAYDVFLGFDGLYDDSFRQQNNPDMWQMFAAFVGENPDLKVRLLHSQRDPTMPFENSVLTQTILSAAGHDAELVVFGGFHEVPVNLTVQTVMDVLGRPVP